MKINDLYVNNISDIACVILDDAIGLDEYGCVSLIAFYDDMKEILKELLNYSSLDLACVELMECEFANYFKEYILTIDSDLKIWIQPMFIKDKYLTYESSIVYVTDDCNRKTLDTNEHESPIVFSLVNADTDEENCECGGYCSNCCKEELHEGILEVDDTKGFSFSKSDDNGSCHYSFYSTDEKLVRLMFENLKI